MMKEIRVAAEEAGNRALIVVGKTMATASSKAAVTTAAVLAAARHARTAMAKEAVFPAQPLPPGRLKGSTAIRPAATIHTREIGRAHV